MIGVEYIRQLTNAFGMDLYVEYEHSGGYIYTAIFKDFTVAAESDGYKYDYTSFHTTGGVIYRFFTQDMFNMEKGSAFTHCSSMFHWWYCWNNVKYDNPTITDYGVVMYLKRSE